MEITNILGDYEPNVCEDLELAFPDGVSNTEVVFLESRVNSGSRKSK